MKQDLLGSTTLAGRMPPGVPMTPAERAMGRYMRAPDGHDGGDTGQGGGADTTSAGAGQDSVQAGGGADTLQGGGGADSVQGGAADDGAKDWRSEWAGDDGEVAKFLGRYASPAAAIKAFKQQHGDIRSGKYIKPVDENSTDAEKAAWAKLMGVPEKPEAYLEKLPDGLVIGDDDKPAIEAFTKAMHTAGAPKGVVDAALQAYYDIVDRQMEAQDQANTAARTATEDALREEWGGDFRRNVNALKGFVEGLPDGVGDALVEAVGSDGVQIMNKPEVVRWLTAMMLDKDPLQTIVPGSGADRSASVEEEIAGIEKVMRTNRAAYNRDQKMQGRLRDLYAAREKLKG
ncbi:hypothetical protein GG804_25005 [Sphingomonas histidinilytica]|uniref:hypothetical protein n=1 Tax=Rhizorhabdus histidinilytica TaxID=439228 RepID=UPI001ADC96EA|nr:hypothetical protein [Rhizorhabdus histidinilytica]MBO9380031.1 hypothetical protein [Rhizorhabdus histidinilytica]